MKVILKKLLIIVLVVLLLNNFVFCNITYAEVTGTDGLSLLGSIIGNLMTTLVGILTIPVRFLAVLVANGFSSLIEAIAYCDNPESAPTGRILTPYDILFNNIGLTKIDFFNIDTSDSTSIVANIRIGVATWYYSMRLISTTILLAILVYVGIRMAISTVASDRALYKKMIVDWTVSLALTFLLHYIIAFVIIINNSLVSVIQSTTANADLNDAMSELIKISFLKPFAGPESMAATFIYCLIVWETLALLISYFNRMLKLAFLIIIAPLITITYSIDKIGDGRAQALNTWLKEFSFTVLIQPFHCIIYASLISMSLQILSNSANSLAASIVAILCIKFVREAEEIVRKIFNFADTNKNTSLQAGAATAFLGMKYARNIGKSAGTIAGKGYNFVRNAPENLANIAADVYAIRTIGQGGKSFNQRKDEYLIERYDKEASKNSDQMYESQEKEYTERINKAQNYEEKERIKKEFENKQIDYHAKYDDRVEQEAKKIYARGGKSMARARAEARRNISKKDNVEEKNKHESVARKRVRGTVNKFNEIRHNSEVYKQLGGALKSTIGGGMAIFGSAGSYSNDGNLFTAVGTGVATYNVTTSGIDEFFKYTGSTLVRNANPILISAGITTEQQLIEYINDTRARNDDLLDSKKLDDLMEELRKVLNESGEDGETATKRFANEIQKSINLGEKVNIEEIFNKSVSPNISGEARAKALGSANKLGGHILQKNLATIINNAEDYGMDSLSVDKRIISSMTEGSYIEAKDYYHEESEPDIITQAKDGEVDTTDMDYKEREKIVDDISLEIDKEQLELYQRQVIGLEGELLDEHIRNLNSNKERIQKELKEEYEETSRQIIKQIEDAKREISDAEAYKLARQIENKDTFLREMNDKKNAIEKQINGKLEEKQNARTANARMKISKELVELYKNKRYFEANSEAVIEQMPVVEQYEE